MEAAHGAAGGGLERAARSSLGAAALATQSAGDGAFRIARSSARDAAGAIGVLATQSDRFDLLQIGLSLDLFTAGLAVTGLSIWIQKVKALRRRDAARNGHPIPTFDTLLERNETPDGISLLLFGLGVLAFVAIPLVH